MWVSLAGGLSGKEGRSLCGGGWRKMGDEETGRGDVRDETLGSRHYQVSGGILKLRKARC